MPTIIQQSELVRRAIIYIDERIKEAPEKSITILVEEAGMRFNLSPLDAAQLENFFRSDPDHTRVKA